MHGKEQIVIRLLKRLCNRVKLAFVATAVIRLRLARHGADEVRVYAHGEAEHVHGLLNVRGPVAAFLLIINTIDAHIVLLLPVRADVECREECLAAVLSTRQEIDDLLLLLHDTLLLLLRVSDAFTLEDALPVAVRHLDMVLQRSRVLQLRLLRHPDKLLDIVPTAFEKCSVVRDRVVGAVGSWHLAYHSKLPTRRLLLHPLLQIAPGVVKREERNLLNLLNSANGLVPVGIQHIFDASFGISRREPAVANLLAAQRHDVLPLVIKDNERHAPSKVLEVLTDSEEVRRKRVGQQEVLHIRFHLCRASVRVIHQPASVAYLRIEHLTCR